MNLKLFPVALLLAVLVSGCNKPAAAGPGGRPGFPPTQVIAVEAKRQPVSEILSLVSSIAANEMVEIKSETDGSVAEINFTEGQPVEKGRLLIRLDDSKLASAAAEAEANFKLTSANYERSQELLRSKLVSSQEFDLVSSQFQASQAALDLKKRLLLDTRILAPFAGIVAARNVSPGQVILKNTTLTWLVDLDPVKVEINVPERFLSQLRIGQNIDLKVASYPGRKFTGKVFFVAPFVDSATRTALVKAQIPNPQQELKPGMFGNLDLTLNIRENAVVIPEAALTQLLEGGRAMIYTISATNTAVLQSVKLGVRLAGLVEVVEGLQGGERVIVEGVQKIGPGSKVNVAAGEGESGKVGKRESEKTGGGRAGEGKESTP